MPISCSPRTFQYLCRQCCPKRGISARRVLTSLFSTSRGSLVGSQERKIVDQRIKELGGQPSVSKLYPRVSAIRDEKDKPHSVERFVVTFDHLKRNLQKGEHASEKLVSVYGSVTSRRKQGSKLAFIDLEDEHYTTQAVLKASSVECRPDGTPGWDVGEERRRMRRGDWIAFTGYPYISDTGELSVLVTEKPQILAPALQHVPLEITDPQFLSHNRHVDLLINKSARDMIVFRSKIVNTLRQFFIDREFLEVNTPLFVAQAGGANARPFKTVATEFPDTKLQLRISPELWLKRLLVGKMGRVFEVGPSFRNEGVDATHNPEFYTCEFYERGADLNSLIDTTEKLLQTLENATANIRTHLHSIPDPASLGLQTPIPRVSFIPGLETAIRTRLPQWEFPDLTNEPVALPALHSALAEFDPAYDSHTAPSSLPTILDALSSEVLESQIKTPTWITHHPACMSPLAKSTTLTAHDSPDGTAHHVSARAELFINGQELVNCYEEENDPHEQRQKFLEQRVYQQHDDEDIDEEYVRALEWSMPPTGGWGCGIDRLVMLFSGRKRIADVLSFGNLSNVVGIGSKGPSRRRE